MDTADFLKMAHASITDMVEPENEQGGQQVGGLCGYGWALSDADAEGRDHIAMFALNIEPEDAYVTMMSRCAEPDTRLLIFGLDRAVHEPSGVAPGHDVFAGLFYERGADPAFRPFIVEYSMDPAKHVAWFNWANPHWTAALLHEMRVTVANLKAIEPGKGPNWRERLVVDGQLDDSTAKRVQL